MSVDDGLRILFHTHLRADFHWQAIETGGTGKGIPDSNYCSRGVEGWVEFKATSAWAVDLMTEQVGWHTERYARGGRTFVAVRRRNQGGVRLGDPVDELWIYPGSLARELRRQGLKNMAPALYCVGGPSRWDWRAAARLLRGEN